VMGFFSFFFSFFPGMGWVIFGVFDCGSVDRVRIKVGSGWGRGWAPIIVPYQNDYLVNLPYYYCTVYSGVSVANWRTDFSRKV
jgi:hypothetical protein